MAVGLWRGRSHVDRDAPAPQGTQSTCALSPCFVKLKQAYALKVFIIRVWHAYPEAAPLTKLLRSTKLGSTTCTRSLRLLRSRLSFHWLPNVFATCEARAGFQFCVWLQYCHPRENCAGRVKEEEQTIQLVSVPFESALSPVIIMRLKRSTLSFGLLIGSVPVLNRSVMLSDSSCNDCLFRQE